FLPAQVVHLDQPLPAYVDPALDTGHAVPFLDRGEAGVLGFRSGLAGEPHQTCLHVFLLTIKLTADWSSPNLAAMDFWNSPPACAARISRTSLSSIFAAWWLSPFGLF